jgi:hypothetical protein
MMSLQIGCSKMAGRAGAGAGAVLVQPAPHPGAVAAVVQPTKTSDLKCECAMTVTSITNEYRGLKATQGYGHVGFSLKSALAGFLTFSCCLFFKPRWTFFVIGF